MAQYTYALIDGVMRQDAIKEIYTFGEAIQVLPLYMNTSYQDCYDLGPILVSVLNSNSNLITTMQSWTNSTTFIQSSEPPHIVFSHLQQFIIVTDESQSQALLRFADPLVTYYWLNSYEKNELGNILGPITQWQIARPIPAWNNQETQWQLIERQPDQQSVSLNLNYLNQPQLDALEEATVVRFKNKIYQWLSNEKPLLFINYTPEQIEIWLSSCYKDAKAFNLISERSIATWINLCADYGQDFAQTSTGLYQQWLRKYPQNNRLPAEVNIQSFYDYIVEQCEQTSI